MDNNSNDNYNNYDGDNNNNGEKKKKRWEALGQLSRTEQDPCVGGG